VGALAFRRAFLGLDKDRMDDNDNMIRVARVADFSTTRLRSYRILGRPVGVFRERDGSFRAMEVACKHQNADLTTGHIRGEEVICPWHGWRYNLRTGECLWGGPSPLRPYHCEVRGEDIFISLRPVRPEELGDPDWPE